MLVTVTSGEYRRADTSPNHLSLTRKRIDELAFGPQSRPADDGLPTSRKRRRRRNRCPDFGKTPHPDDLSAAPGFTVKTEVAYGAMMDAIRDNIDPLMVEVKTDCGMYVRLCSCIIRSINGAPLSAYEVLKIVRMDRQDEILAERDRG